MLKREKMTFTSQPSTMAGNDSEQELSYYKDTVVPEKRNCQN